MITLLLIIIGSILGIYIVSPACEHIYDNSNSKYRKKVQRRNIILLIIGGLIGAIIFPLCFIL